MINTVCHDCKNRYIGCHSICKDYLAEQEQSRKLKEKIRKNKEISKAFQDHQFASINQMHKDGGHRT